MTPRQLALSLLRARFARSSCTDAGDGLAGFQRDAVARLDRALLRYGGALLADSVGLGKNHISTATARLYRARGEPVIVVLPSSLRAHWARVLRGLDGIITITHGTLSRGGARIADEGGVLLVDEAHAFRNPATRRYAALARLALGRKLLLITATPVNNSLWDLYWLLRLFAADDAFLALGVADLYSCIREAERTGRSGRIPAILAQVAVRRTRTQVQDSAGALALRFPARAPPRPVEYAVDAAQRRRLLDGITRLELAPWADSGSSELLLRLTLLKRAESSHAALAASLGRLRETLRAFVDALDRGALLGMAERRLCRRDGDQLALDPLLLRPLPAALDAAALRASAARDLAIADALLQSLAAAPDPKLEPLRALLRDLGNAPVLVFSEFRDTAIHLWRALRDEWPCALIHGSGAFLGRSPASRRTVIERFAPRANHAPDPSPRERVQLLIATDVLAEGLNLQDAADLVSYDLPWNPVRLLQRVGRIDRLGSPHALVRASYFVPDAELESLLRLVQRLERKLRAIRSSVGEDGEVLSGVTFDGRVPDLDRIEREDAALFDIEERLRAALAREDRAAALAALPLGRATNPVARPARPPRGLKAAVLNLPERPASALALVFFGARAVFVTPRRCFEDDVLAGELLLAALRFETPIEPDPAAAPRAASRAARWLTRPRVTRHGSPGAALQRRLIALLQQRPGGPTEAECLRAESLLAGLRKAHSVGTARALARLLKSRGPNDFGALAERIDECLGPRRALPPARPAEPRSAPPADGVFLLRPPLTDPRHPAIVTGSTS